MLRAPTGQLRRAGVVGCPIGHSLSPALHGAAHRALGLEHWRYTAQEVRPGALAAHLRGMDRTWAGLSVTMPLKREALAAAAAATDLARQTGAANTLLRRPDGDWAADNTDVHGVRAALAAAGVTDAGRATVIGSGATARSAVAALSAMGLGELTLLVRDQPRPQVVEQAGRYGIRVRHRRYDQAGAVLAGSPLVVSTVPPGAAPTVEQVAPPAGAVLLDVVYAGWPTPLARHFAGAGARVVGGLDMLVHQAAEQVRLMTGLQPPVEVMMAAGRAEAGR